MVQTDTNAFAILTTTPHQHALSELSARARDGQELINASLTHPEQRRLF
jgi:hypothetical protein